MARIFRHSEAKNIGFYITGIGSDKPFSVLATDLIPDLTLSLGIGSNGQSSSRAIHSPSADPNEPTYVEGD